MWRRFTTTGAVVRITTGLVSAVALIVMSPVDVRPRSRPITVRQGP